MQRLHNAKSGVRGSADASIRAPLALAMFLVLVCALRAEGDCSLQIPKSWKCSNTNRDIGAAVKPLPVEQKGGFLLTQSFLL